MEYPIDGEPAPQYDASSTDSIIRWTIVGISSDVLELSTSAIGMLTGKLNKSLSNKDIFSGRWWISEPSAG